MVNTLGPTYNEQLDAKKSIHCKQVLVITELAVARVLLIVQCSYYLIRSDVNKPLRFQVIAVFNKKYLKSFFVFFLHVFPFNVQNF